MSVSYNIPSSISKIQGLKTINKRLEIKIPNIGFNTSFKVDPSLYKDAEQYINSKMQSATTEVINKLADALDKAMMSNVWNTNSGAADIIDTGKLLASRNINYSNGTLTISYDVPYFGIVHFGGYMQPYGNINAKKVYIPARPWITYTLYGGGPVPKFDFEAAYKQALGGLVK